MSKQFAAMSKTLSDLKNQLGTIDERKAALAAQQAQALMERDRLDKQLVTDAIHHPAEYPDTERRWREADESVKRLGAILAGLADERARLEREVFDTQKQLGDYLTSESTGWYTRALADYEKNLSAFVGSLNRLLAANHTLAAHGGHPASIFGRYGSEWTRLFGPALYSVEGGKAHRLEFGADQKTLDSVRKELLG